MDASAIHRLGIDMEGLVVFHGSPELHPPAQRIHPSTAVSTALLLTATHSRRDDEGAG